MSRNWRIYRQLRNRVNRDIKKAKSDYYTNLIQENQGDAKGFWKALKKTLPSLKTSTNISSLRVDGAVVTSDESIATVLNNFFVSIGRKLAEKFPDLSSSNQPEDNPNATGFGFSFQLISESFVRDAIKRLKPNKAIGLDKISARLLKDSGHTIVPSLTSLFNLSLQTETFPSVWKNARVIPLYKKGDKQDPSNYRPISVLPTVNKSLENAVHTQFYGYLTENNLTSSKQFGFRLQSSTATASAQFIDQLLFGMDNGTVTGAVLLDLTKAFDTVNHSILSRKLSRFGVDDTAQNWFDSFLSNRNQVTCCGRAQSDPDIVSVVAAQGSILGPLLFIIYMNDLPNVLKSCSVTLYADDTVLYFSSKLISEIETKMNSDLRQVCDWLKLNQLTLNIKKSQFMLIGCNSRLRRIESIVISADGKQLKEAQCFPYVGLIINQNLTWEDHIEHMRNKINKKLGLLRIKLCLPLRARITFFNSFVLPLFDYGDIIWGDRGNTTLMAELQILHNKAARIILDLPPTASASDALSKLHWKPLDRWRTEHRAIFMFKVVNNLFMHTFHCSFNSNYHNYNTRSKRNIRKSSAHRRWGHWITSNFAADAWNALPLSQRDVPTLSQF